MTRTEMLLGRELNQAAILLALAAHEVRWVDFEGERYDLLAEAERINKLLDQIARGMAP